MKIKLDENIPVTAKDTLANVSSDIHAVYEEGLSGADDGTLWDVCQQEQRFLITQDLDFSDTRRFSPGTHCGILLLRLKNPSVGEIKTLLMDLAENHQLEQWNGCVVVATRKKVRIYWPLG